MQKLLSIITVTYNCSSTIESCLQSILSQKNSDVEYVVIDGASSDGTEEKLKAHQHQIDRLVSEKDSGVYNAMNKGWRLSSGSFVLFINSDDEMLPGSVEFILQTIKALNQEEMIFAPVIMTDKQNYVLRKPVINEKKYYYYTMPVCHQGMVLKKSLLEKYEGFDESFRVVADHDLLIKTLKDKTPFKTLDKAVTLFQVGGASKGISYYPELSRLYRLHHFPLIPSMIYTLYFKISSYLQRNLSPSAITLIKQLKRSRTRSLKIDRP